MDFLFVQHKSGIRVHFKYDYACLRTLLKYNSNMHNNKISIEEILNEILELCLRTVTLIYSHPNPFSHQ